MYKFIFSILIFLSSSVVFGVNTHLMSCEETGGSMTTNFISIKSGPNGFESVHILGTNSFNPSIEQISRGASTQMVFDFEKRTVTLMSEETFPKYQITFEMISFLNAISSEENIDQYDNNILKIWSAETLSVTHQFEGREELSGVHLIKCSTIQVPFAKKLYALMLHHLSNQSTETLVVHSLNDLN